MTCHFSWQLWFHLMDFPRLQFPIVSEPGAITEETGQPCRCFCAATWCLIWKLVLLVPIDPSGHGMMPSSPRFCLQWHRPDLQGLSLLITWHIQSLLSQCRHRSVRSASSFRLDQNFRIFCWNSNLISEFTFRVLGVSTGPQNLDNSSLLYSTFSTLNFREQVLESVPSLSEALRKIIQLGIHSPGTVLHFTCLPLLEH